MNSSLFGPASLGNHYRDARNMVLVLQNMESGISTYKAVLSGLQGQHGAHFIDEFYDELNRNQKQR